MQKFVLLYSFCCVILNLRAVSKYKPPGAYIWRGDLTQGFLRYEYGGLIHGGVLFSGFYSICCHWPRACNWKSAQPSDQLVTCSLQVQASTICMISKSNFSSNCVPHLLCHYFFKTIVLKILKAIIRFGFCDIWDYQSRDKCYSALVYL